MGNGGGKSNDYFAPITFGYNEKKGKRPTMEDAHILTDKALGVRSHYFFAVFDGHGGDQVAKYASAHMLKRLSHMRPMRSSKSSAEQLGKCLKKVHLDLDVALRNEKPKGYGIADFCGCTAVSCLVTPTHFVVANLGDSRAVACRGMKALALSTDHKPYDDKEKARIERAGGKVFWGRVNGKLAVSRALGDFVHKGEEGVAPQKYMVTPVADIKIFKRTDEDRFLVLACDGVWDVLSNDDACTLVLKMVEAGEKDCDVLAAHVVDEALRKGSTDNITAIVALLSRAAPPDQVKATKA